MEVKTVGLASDHAGYALKQFVKEYLAEKGYAYKDFGTILKPVATMRLCPSFGPSCRRRGMLSGHSHLRQR